MLKEKFTKREADNFLFFQQSNRLCRESVRDYVENLLDLEENELGYLHKLINIIIRCPSLDSSRYGYHT